MNENNSKNRRNDILSKISQDRKRTNLLKSLEQRLIVFLVQRIPAAISSDMLTGIGFAGSLVVTAGFVLGKYIDRHWLLLGVAGFAINWFGDSLDGRLAYYRNKPRKWYGFSLDFTIDWLSNIAIGSGYILYVDGLWEMVGFGFVMLYGWAMITTLLRYRITGKYSIDSGLLSPTEVRVIISLLLILEVIFPGSFLYAGIAVCAILLIVNIIDFVNLLKIANLCDREEQN